MTPDVEPSTSLNARRRRRDLERLYADPTCDLLVIGGGVTGAGTALDAAARGLSVVLVERHDLAHGTSRWSSKLVHGGLRYLVQGHPSVAMESAVERDIMFRHTAPHLVRAAPAMLPLFPATPRTHAALYRAAQLAGEGLRRAARTPGALLPHGRRITRAEALHLAPGLREGISGGLLGWDGQLADDARLVVSLARTAAGLGARVITRCSARDVTGEGALLHDELTGDRLQLRARAAVNAAGVWAGDLVDEIRLRPSRGTHLVFRDAAVLGGLRTGLTLAVPGEVSRFVLVLPQPDGRVYVGPTDEPLDGPVPDVPEPTDDEYDYLLGTLNTVLHTTVTRQDVAGAFSGLRPLLDTGSGHTSDLSRKHAVLVSRTGVVTIVGGKLTTYRRMAEHAVDAAIRRAGLEAGPSRTRRLPLVGAAPSRVLAEVPAPRRMITRYGAEAPAVISEAAGDPAYHRPVADGLDVTAAELLFAVRHEGALDVDDLLHRRTRIGLVADDLERVRPAAVEALARAEPPLVK